MLRATSILLAASLLPTERASAQDPAADFLPLWSAFIAACGPILSDPMAAMDDQRTFPGYDMSAWHINEDNTDATAEHYAADVERSISWHLIRSEVGFNLFCDAHDFSGLSSDLATTAAGIRGLFEASEDMTLSGGAAQVRPGTHPDLTSPTSGAYHSLVVEGAFPGAPHAVVHLHVEEFGLAATLYTAWEVEE